jgi:hypothetical protein
VRAAVTFAVLASFWGLGRVAAAQVCEDTTSVMAGRPAPCTGLLLPPSRARQCVEDVHAAEACRIRLAGCERVVEIRQRACAEREATLIAALEAEREAGRESASPPSTWSWSSFGVGLGVGGAVVAALVVGILVATR